MDESISETEKQAGKAANTPLTVIFVEDDLPNDVTIQSAMKELENEVIIQAFSEEFVAEVSSTSRINNQNRVFVTRNFDDGPGSLIQRLKKKCTILGPPAFIHFAETMKRIPTLQLKRPQYNNNMEKVNALLSGYSGKAFLPDLERLLNLIHSMGGHVKNEHARVGAQFPITHLVSCWVQGEKYQTAVNMGIPIVAQEWVEMFWREREKKMDPFGKKWMKMFAVKPFFRLKFYLVGFEEVESLQRIIEENGGTTVERPEDASIVIVDTANKPDKVKVTWEELGQQRIVTVAWAGFSESLALATDQALVGVEWFWYCVQIDSYAVPTLYSLIKLNSSTSSTQKKKAFSPKKRLSVLDEKEASLGHVSFDRSDDSLSELNEPNEVNELNELNEQSSESQSSGSFPSKRRQTVEEMILTEANYIKTLSYILKIKEAAANPNQPRGAVYDAEAIAQMDEYTKTIPDILNLHTMIHRELDQMTHPWDESCLIGDVWRRFGPRLEAAYPPFVNSIERLKKHIDDCQKKFPRFCAHLALCQMSKEFERHHLKDLLLRPVQRLPSVLNLLKKINLNTKNNNPDHAHLEAAVLEIERVLTFLNEEKRAAEIEDLMKEIENVPLCFFNNKHHVYKGHVECFELSSHQFHSKGSGICLILFSDVLEVAKRRFDKRFENTKNTKNTKNTQNKQSLKHLEFIPLGNVKGIVDVRDEGDTVRGAFLLVLSSQQDSSSVSDYKLALTQEFLAEKKKKRDFLLLLKAQILANDCTANPLGLLRDATAEDVGIKNTTAPETTWDKVGKLPRTVSRRFSSIKSSGQKMKRAISSAFLTPTAPKNGGKSLEDSDVSLEITPKKLFKR